MLLRVDHLHRVSVLARHVGARAVGQERGRPRARRDGELADHGGPRRVDREHVAVLLRRRVDDGAVRRHLDPFRLAADLHRGHDARVGGLHHADGGGVLVGHEQPPAVLADRELLRVRAHRDDLDELERAHVHDADAVGGAVGRGQGLLVHARRGEGRSAERHVEDRRRPGSTRTPRGRLPRGMRGHHRLRREIDDAQVAGALVGHVEARTARRGGGVVAGAALGAGEGRGGTAPEQAASAMAKTAPARRAPVGRTRSTSSPLRPACPRPCIRIRCRPGSATCSS